MIKNPLSTFSLTTIGMLFLLVHNLFAQSQTNERGEWFVDSRFGMFIHWGLYSGAEGIWKGEKLRNDNDYAEWIYYRNRIDREEYLKLIERFDWDAIDPEKWVILAKKSGMKYITLTAKHHDGFGLWDSEVSDYDLGNYTNPKRDIVKELAEACQKHGLKFGLYYSHWVDWEHQYGWDHTREIYQITPEQYDEYWQQKVMPQMRELLTQYGPIHMIWFDMWIHHSNTIVSKNQLLQLKSLIRELQPECLVNSRLGLSVEEDSDVDFRTLGDNQLGSQKLDYPWQSPGTVAHSWGYHQLDTEWKSTTSLLKALIGNVSLNGNYMLNIGPRSNGNVPYEISQRMLDMGAWLDVNGEAIYGAEAFDLSNNLHDWGKITYKATDNKKHLVYLHIYNWPYNHTIPLTGITTEPVRVYALRDKLRSPLKFQHQDLFTEISLDNYQTDPLISVIALEYDQKPEIANIKVAKTVDGGYSLTQNKVSTEEGERILRNKSKGGTVPEHIEISEDYSCSWNIYVDTPGNINFDLSYSFQGDAPKANFSFKIGDETLSHKVNSTGQTVGEPNQNWHIDNFVSHSIGSIHVQEAGKYTISMQVENEGNDPVKFQWLWIK